MGGQNCGGEEGCFGFLCLLCSAGKLFGGRRQISGHMICSFLQSEMKDTGKRRHKTQTHPCLAEMEEKGGRMLSGSLAQAAPLPQTPIQEEAGCVCGRLRSVPAVDSMHDVC